MLESKHKGILSLNLKKLANLADDLKIILILQNEMLLLMLFRWETHPYNVIFSVHRSVGLSLRPLHTIYQEPYII